MGDEGLTKVRLFAFLLSPVLYTGDTAAVLDSTLEEAFKDADAGLTKVPCSSVVTSATLERRLNRRRLQTGGSGGSTTIEFEVISNQVNTSALYQNDNVATDFLNNYNGHPLIQSNSVLGKSARRCRCHCLRVLNPVLFHFAVDL